MADFQECNFDSIVGPTHNYAGLAYGNVASKKNSNRAAYPREAALQGLSKMKALADRGLHQAVLPPLLRPRLDWLSSVGFRGTGAEIAENAWRQDPAIAAAAYSSSNMWAANAATVSPSVDSSDGKAHFTPANLSTAFHRSIEGDQIEKVFQGIFADQRFFRVHSPLPSAAGLSDEGAANHTRLCPDHAKQGLQVFVYGRNALDASAPAPVKFPARQTLQASQSVARLHQLKDVGTFFLSQNPDSIDAGVFHNDVISVGNENMLLVHQESFLDWSKAKPQLQQAYHAATGQTLIIHEVSSQMLPLQDVVSSYLFNSQLITTRPGKMALVSPTETQNNPKANAAVEAILAGDNPVEEVLYFDLRQSMNNGGGPACLRLRVVLNEEERQAVHPNVWMNGPLYRQLTQWVADCYPEKLTQQDLQCKELIEQSRHACSELAAILDLPLLKWFT